MTEQLALSYCHQPILGSTNYWAHDAAVDSSPKAQQPEGFICSVNDHILLIGSKGREIRERDRGDNLRTRDEKKIIDKEFTLMVTFYLFQRLFLNN